MTSTLLLLGISLASLIYGIILYKQLVNFKRAVSKAWTDIDVALGQRHDELTRLIAVCKPYKQFEQKALQRVSEACAMVQAARDGMDIAALGKAEGQLRSSLGRLYAVAEAHPELKHDEHFMQLQTRISGLENTIADQRTLYNESVNRYNAGIEQFPAALISNMFAYQSKPLLEFSSTEKRK